MITHYDITLQGTLCGPIWWPVGVKCGRDITINLSRSLALMGEGDERPTLRSALLHVQMHEGGDFQGCQFTVDTVLTVASHHNGRRTYRDWPITAFPSVADLVDEDTYGWEFQGGED